LVRESWYAAPDLVLDCLVGVERAVADPRMSWTVIGGRGVLLLVELRLQHVHALSTGPLASCFFCSRIALHTVFSGSSAAEPMRVQLREDLIERTAHNRATLLPPALVQQPVHGGVLWRN
jgi:hypothetical protein